MLACLGRRPARGSALALGAAFLLRLGGRGDQLVERVVGMLRIEVQHQPVLVVARGLEREHLRRHRLLQVEDDAQGFGVELADAHLPHERILRADARQQLAHLRFDLQPLQIENDPVGVVDQPGTEGDGLGQLESDPGVLARRPHAHGRNAVTGVGSAGYAGWCSAVERRALQGRLGGMACAAG